MGPAPAQRESFEVDYSGVRAGFRDLNFSYLFHPLVAATFLVVAPLLSLVNLGLEPNALLAEMSGALPAVLLAFLAGHQLLPPRKSLKPTRVAYALTALSACIALGSILATLINPGRVPEGGATPGEADFSGLVLLATTLAFTMQHLFVWLLAMVVMGGSLAYRSSKATLGYSRGDDEHHEPGKAGLTSLEELRSDTVSRIDSALRELETGISRSAYHATELAEKVHALRQDVISPALSQLAQAADSAHPGGDPRTIVAPKIPWRWRGVYFSGTVGALLIGAIGLLTVAPDAVRAIGPLVQLPLIMAAFFVSVPASVILLLTAALTPFLQPNEGVPENFGLFAIVVALVVVSFIQRFNQVRRVRVLETASVNKTLGALAAIQARHQIEAFRRRINQVLHGSIQATLLAIELGLRQSGTSSSAKAQAGIASVRESLESLKTPDEPELDFASALDSVVKTWSAGINVHVDLSPSAATLLQDDVIAASAVLEIITEGTSNAIKHAGAKDVEVSVGHEAPFLRVRVSHASDSEAGPKPPITSNGIGMRQLAELTSSLRLLTESGLTTLYAEIPYSLSTSRATS